MKKVALILSVLLVVSFAWANSWNVTVTTNAVMVVPPAAVSSAAAYATNTTYAQGAMVSNSNVLYWAVAGGTNQTSGGAPSVHYGTETDADVTWARLNKNARKVAIITNLSTNDIFLDDNTSVTTNAGVLLGQNSSWIIELRNEPVYAISGGTNVSVSVYDK
tara:strand:+ start:372 stop:857 length:486 start_codon:yes stop_codon:yes gene_type:complete